MLFPKSLPLFALMVLVLVTAGGCVPVSTSSTSQPATGAPVAPVVRTEAATDLSTPAAAGLRPITVANVTVDVGVGSPIPVDAFVSGEWPDLCAQLAQITQRVEGKTFDITLLATAADPACPPDFLGLPFRIAIPINVVELPEGQYTVTANGATTTLQRPRDLAGQPAASRGPRDAASRRGNRRAAHVAGRDDRRPRRSPVAPLPPVSRITKVPIPTVPRPPSTSPTMRPCGNTWRTTARAGRAN